MKKEKEMKTRRTAWARSCAPPRLSCQSCLKKGKKERWGGGGCKSHRIATPVDKLPVRKRWEEESSTADQSQRIESKSVRRRAVSRGRPQAPKTQEDAHRSTTRSSHGEYTGAGRQVARARGPGGKNGSTVSALGGVALPVEEVGQSWVRQERLRDVAGGGLPGYHGLYIAYHQVWRVFCTRRPVDGRFRRERPSKTQLKSATGRVGYPSHGTRRTGATGTAHSPIIVASSIARTGAWRRRSTSQDNRSVDQERGGRNVRHKVHELEGRL
ncbi:hypothetical protein C8J57DRAFT_1476429 [Mycena rebaudengoi]|nr:hypothetical protein C8J57DRAFT_1476429 [Mycena rebaudengoi]